MQSENEFLATFILSYYNIHHWLFVFKVNDIISLEFPGLWIHNIVQNALVCDGKIAAQLL